VGKVWGTGLARLTAGFLCLLALPRTALAEDVVVGEAVADDQGAGSLCIASSQIGREALAQLVSRHLKIDGRFPSDVAAANGLHQCAAAFVGGYSPASIGLLALGGIFGNLCAAGELGCGPSGDGGGSPPPGPPGPPGPPFVRPTARPPVPHPTPPAVSPFR
jgi:hypothetical protein